MQWLIISQFTIWKENNKGQMNYKECKNPTKFTDEMLGKQWKLVKEGLILYSLLSIARQLLQR